MLNVHPLGNVRIGEIEGKWEFFVKGLVLFKILGSLELFITLKIFNRGEICAYFENPRFKFSKGIGIFKGLLYI